MNSDWDAEETPRNLELLLALITLNPAPITASGRLRAPTLRALQERLSAWKARHGADNISGAGHEPESREPCVLTASVPALISLAERLNLVAATAGHLRPLPNATTWLALPPVSQQHDIHEANRRAGPEDSSGWERPLRLADQAPSDPGVASLAERGHLRLGADLTLLDSPHTQPGARLALAPWAEWDNVLTCLRLTKVSVSRAAAPILATGQDAASVLANLLRRLAEPVPTEAQLRRLHAWCVATTATKAGDRPPHRNSLSGDVGTMTWRLAALRLVEALAPLVPGIGSPPAEAYEGLVAVANPAMNEMVHCWVSAIVNAKGMGGLPIGVDPQLLEAVETALAMGEDLHLQYRSGEAAEGWRQITPLRLEWHRGRLLLVAHCHLRGAERSFRMDRVLELRPASGWPADTGRPL